MAATITSTASVVRVDSSYKEFSSAVGSTTTVVQFKAGEAPASGDAGRFLLWCPGGITGLWEARYILSATSTTVTVGDGGFSAAPAEDDLIKISTTFDDINAVVPGEFVKSGIDYNCGNRTLRLTNGAFVADVKKSIQMRVDGADEIILNMAVGTVFQMGRLTGGERNNSTETTAGGTLVLENLSSTEVSQGIGSTYTSESTSGPVVNLYDTEVISKTTAPSYYIFMRFGGPARLIGCNLNGPAGGRLLNVYSELVDCRFHGNDNAVVSWGIGATFIRDIDNVFFYDGVAALKTYQTFSGILKNSRFSLDTLNKVVSVAGTTGTTQFVDCTTFTDSYIDDTGSGTLLQKKSINYVITDSTGTPIEGAVVAVYNNVMAIQDAVRTSDALGVVEQINARFYTWVNTGSGTYHTPFDIRTRAYGYVNQSIASNVDSSIRQQNRMVTDNQIVLSKSAAAALTGISVSEGGAINVSETMDLTQVYARQKWYMTQAAQIDNDDPVLATPVLFDMGDWDLTISGGTVSCLCDRPITTTGDISVTSLGVLDVAVELTSGTITVSRDSRLSKPATISGTAVLLIETPSDTDLPPHVIGAGGKIVVSGISVSNTLNLIGSTFDATSIIENTSGSPIIVRIDNGATLPVLLETSGTIEIYTPPISTNILAPNIIDGSKFLVFINGTATGGLQTVSGGAGINITYTKDTDYTAGQFWEIWIMYYSAGTGAGTCKIELDLSGQFGATTNETIRTEAQEDCPVYVALGWDGADYEGQYSIDTANDEVDIDVTPNFNATQLFSYLKYAQTVSEANTLDLFGEFGADDVANYFFTNIRRTLKFDNTTAGRAQESSGVRWYAKSGTGDPVKTGENIDINWRENVYIAETGVSGLTLSESAKLMSLDTTNLDATVSSRSTFNASTDEVVTNSASREASKATGFATPTNVSDAQTAIIAQVDANEAKIDLIETKAQADARQALLIAEHDATQAALITTGQIRTELATELGRIDVAVSSRNATAPDNAGITAIKAKTDQLNFTGTDVQSIASNMRGTDSAITSLVPVIDAVDAAVLIIKGADDRDLTEVYDNVPAIDLSGVALEATAQSIKTTVEAVETKAQADDRQAILVANQDAIGITLDSALEQATLARKHLTNRDKIDTTTKTLVRYDDDGTSPLVTYDLKGATGAPDALAPFEKVPQ